MDDDSLIASIEYAQTRQEADDLGIDQSELIYRRIDEHMDQLLAVSDVDA